MPTAPPHRLRLGGSVATVEAHHGADIDGEAEVEAGVPFLLELEQAVAQVEHRRRHAVRIAGDLASCRARRRRARSGRRAGPRRLTPLCSMDAPQLVDDGVHGRALARCRAARAPPSSSRQLEDADRGPVDRAVAEVVERDVLLHQRLLEPRLALAEALERGWAAGAGRRRYGGRRRRTRPARARPPARIAQRQQRPPARRRRPPGRRRGRRAADPRPSACPAAGRATMIGDDIDAR